MYYGAGFEVALAKNSNILTEEIDQLHINYQIKFLMTFRTFFDVTNDSGMIDTVMATRT